MNARTAPDLLATYNSNPADKIQELRAKFPHLQFSHRQHDTHEIMQIYLQRPSHTATMRFSQWFCLAHGLQDWELQCAASSGECKSRLIDRGYIFLSLEPLHELNKREQARRDR